MDGTCCAGVNCEIAPMCARFRWNATQTLCSFASNAAGPAVHWVPGECVVKKVALGLAAAK